ncbi:MAG: nitrophenyl compound nitroreductase subunit ArsF family protein [bacterium]|nr:nitrophenyl compound nitroreductase subunit ArsF family protein [bacterium]
MKAKWIVLIVAALAVVVVGLVVLRPSAPKSESECGSCEGCAENVAGGCPGATATSEKPASVPDSNAVVVAYYFYTTQRCSNCIKIETYTKEAVETGFADAMQGGKLVWKMVNTDLPENEHFLKDYKLVTKSVVLSDVRSGKEMRWKNLDKIWMLLRDKDEFQKYVRAEVHGFMKA